MKKTVIYLKYYWSILIALAVYVYFSNKFDFIQDDSYISFRYVANLLDGHGLVFNIGERVEGITNFGWVIILSLWGFINEGYIFAARLMGLLAGGGIIVMTHRLTMVVLGDRDIWLPSMATLLVGCNMSLAYWSPAGLETAAFALMVMLSVYWYLKQNWLLIWGLLMAVWLRPEGAFVAGLLILIDLVLYRRAFGFALKSALIALAFSLPFVGFKLLYYGSILPNPFYAKTGWNTEQLVSGLEYVGRFMQHYGFYGVPLILPLIFFKRLSRAAQVLWIFVIVYLMYIILVGGDVLKVHRFFLPIVGAYAALVVLSLSQLLRFFESKTRLLLTLVIAVPLLALTLYLPQEFVNRYNHYEKLFVQKMAFMADNMALSDNSDFSVALPTIGVFGYKLLGHDIIDMVGLTDSTIARHSEEPIPGMSTSWKESKHNSRYLLQRAPDYILFSTGIKPSAPAERALCLYSQFQQSYRSVGWFYQSTPSDLRGSLAGVFKKMRPIEGELKQICPVEFVQHYKRGLDYYVAGDHRKAVQEYDLALRVSSEPYYIYLLYQRAFSLLRQNDIEHAIPALNDVLARDSLIYEAHRDMYLIRYIQGDSTGVAVHEKWLRKLVPWYLPKVQSDARQILQKYQNVQRGR